MKNETILKKAIEKAVKNGWKNDSGGLLQMSFRYRDKAGASFEEWLYDFNTYRVIIFSPDFAKAFFGEKKGEKKGEYYCISGPGVLLFEWQYRQHQMLDEIQEGRDPILYLRRFL